MIREITNEQNFPGSLMRTIYYRLRQTEEDEHTFIHELPEDTAIPFLDNFSWNDIFADEKVKVPDKTQIF